nr:MAG: major capsid protein [Microvirus sp.]
MKSINQSHFARAPSANIQRSSFDRSHGYKTTFNASDLVPIFVDEALPGDTFNLKASFFARLNTPIKPIMDNMYFETFFFEIPVRQVWDNWQKFNGEQDNPGDSTDFLIPTGIAPPITGYEAESLGDYMGIPTLAPDLVHSALFMRAYQHVWNTWFRDQNLQDSIVIPKDDGPDTHQADSAMYEIRQRGKRHDYFTSALPWPQKSDSGSVSIPLGTSAPVATDAPDDGVLGIVNQVGILNAMRTDSTTLTVDDGSIPPAANAMYADLTEATAATINQLRQSIAVQRLFEKDARGGTRYIEVIYNHFKVQSPDLRLQRPGYLGGGRTTINITPVAQTTGSSDVQSADNPQGNLAGYGTLAATNHGFTKSFTEHTIIIGLCNVRADITYQESLNRMWSRQTRFDHYWPELATIGEQEVLTKEIWATAGPADDDVWGYQERFAEYRYKPSLITGKMRSSDPQSLDIWHLSQDFGSQPLLNEEFITENVPIDRIVAVPSEPHFKLDSYFSLKCARPMPMYGIPGLDKL